MDYSAGILPNGIRYIHKQIKGKVAHCGIIINVGSRDELDSEHGMAHFIEHAIFKGTTKRKAFHILSRLDDVGGEIDAYTTKEDTVVHATFIPSYYDRALELINDMVFNSTFLDKELKNEKEVIYDEIASYKDSPSELIFDDFEELVFKDHPIGRNILGTKKALQKIKNKHINSFIERTFQTDQIIICSIGDIPFKKFEKYILKYFSSVVENRKSRKRNGLLEYSPTNKLVKKKTHQTHCIIGNLAYNVFDERKYTLGLLNNLIAGPALNSRLNLSLRENHGLVYNIESSYQPYTDTGVFTLYFGTDHSNYDKCLELIDKEFKLLTNKKLGTMQLAKAKKQIIGQLIINAESNTNKMMHFGKSYLLYNKVESLNETNKKIESITANAVQNVANEILAKKELSILTYK